MNDLKAYLKWKKKVKLILYCHTYSEEKKVKLVVIDFTNYAIIWWDKLVLSKKKNHERSIDTQDEMKAIMMKKFIPSHYYWDLYQKLQSLTQNSTSIKNYYKDMEVAI